MRRWDGPMAASATGSSSPKCRSHIAIGAALVAREAIRCDRCQRASSPITLTLHLTPRAEAQPYIEQRVAAFTACAAGFTQLVPLQNWGWKADFRVRGTAMPGRPIAGFRYVTPGVSSGNGNPHRSWSRVHQHDDAVTRVIVVNEALVRRYLPNEDPIGMDSTAAPSSASSAMCVRPG